MSISDPWGGATINPNDDFADLDSFAGDYRPQHVLAAGVDTLRDGDYDCVIDSAEVSRINQDRVVRINLQLSTGGRIEWLHWLNKQSGVNGLCADLAVLGFDADRWGPAHNRPLSTEIPKAVTALKGIRFRGRKASRPGTGQYAGKTFHDFRVSCRLDGRPMPSLQAPPNGNPVQAPAPPGPVYTPGDGEDGPF